MPRRVIREPNEKGKNMSQLRFAPCHAGRVMAVVLCALVATSYMVFGQSRGGGSGSPLPRPNIIIHLSSGPDDIFASTLALRMAEEALNRNQRVTLYLDRRGVRIAQQMRTDELRLGNEDPLWFILDHLAERRGLEVIVCGESALIQGLYPRDFMHYTLIADTPATILSKMNVNTVVMKY
jgi:predicted peroxiredoxin